MLSQSLLFQHQGTKICDQPKYHQIASVRQEALQEPQMLFLSPLQTR
ncbi:unnamed protein product, partial [Vitis vinifera]